MLVGTGGLCRRIRRSILLVLLALALVIPAATQAQATRIKETVIEPFDDLIVSCTGEDVHLTGEQRITAMTVIDDRGGIHTTFQLVPQNVRGVGLTSGIEYKAVGSALNSVNADAETAPLVSTSMSMFNLVSQGGGDNLQVKFTVHFTVNANGEVTAVVENFSAKCVG